jgi:hypothetical protein
VSYLLAKVQKEEEAEKKMKCFWRFSIVRSEKKNQVKIARFWFSVSSQKYIKKGMIKYLYFIFDL